MVAASHSFSLNFETREVSAGSSVDYAQLACVLSPTAQIYLPGSDNFADAVARWSNASVPVSNVVVVPGTEQDVVKTVCLKHCP